MPIKHGNTGYPAVNAALGAEFARNGGILGAIRGSPDAAEMEKNRQLQMAIQKLLGEQALAQIGAQGKNQLNLEGERGKNQVTALNTEGEVNLKIQNTRDVAELDRLIKSLQGRIDQIKTSGDEERKGMATAGGEARKNIGAQSLAQIMAIIAQGGQTRKNIGAEGDESRKNIKATGDQNERLAGVQSSNRITEGQSAQQNDVLGRNNIVAFPTTENAKVFSEATTDPIVRGILQQQVLGNAVRATPEFGRSLELGMNAQNLAPAYANQKMGTISAAPGSFNLVPPISNGLPPADLNKWGQVQGATEQQTIEPTMLDYGDGNVMPGQPKVINSTVPGRVRQQVDPDLMKRATEMFPQIAPPQIPSVDLPASRILPQAGSGVPFGGGVVFPSPTPKPMPKGYEKYGDAIQYANSPIQNSKAAEAEAFKRILEEYMRTQSSRKSNGLLFPN